MMAWRMYYHTGCYVVTNSLPTWTNVSKCDSESLFYLVNHVNISIVFVTFFLLFDFFIIFKREFIELLVEWSVSIKLHCLFHYVFIFLVIIQMLINSFQAKECNIYQFHIFSSHVDKEFTYGTSFGVFYNWEFNPGKDSKLCSVSLMKYLLLYH